MIPKISSGNNYNGLLNYLEDKKDKIISLENELDLVLGSERISIANFSLDKDITLITDKELLADDFELWDKMCKNRSFDKKVGHFSLSFAPEDNLSNDKIIMIAKEFMERMGYKNNPMAIYKHNDKHHDHIHIITSRVGEDGKKINDSNEIRRSITICRELEIKHDLFRVIKGESIWKMLNEISDKTVTASADVPFKNTIIQNLQYYLNFEKVTDLITLQKMLRLHKIDMVLHDKDGNRLPQNGVRFYFKNGNKVISYLGGKNFEKNFISNLEERLLANKNGIKYEKVGKDDPKEFIPTHKPNYKIQNEIGVILYKVIQDCIKSNLISPDDLIKLLEKDNIKPEFKIDKSGKLIGLSFIVNNIRYKSSDFEINGIKLSAKLLAPHFVENPSVHDAIKIAIDFCKNYKNNTGDSQLTKQEIIEILNRNNFKLVEDKEGKGILSFVQFGKKIDIDLSLLKEGGYQEFLKDCGYDGLTKLPIEQQQNNERGLMLAQALNLKEGIVYKSLLKGDLKEIQEVSKFQIEIKLTPSENIRLFKQNAILNHYNGIHNKMVRAKKYLSSKPKQQKQTLYEIIKALNLRGISVHPTFKLTENNIGYKREIKNIQFGIIGDKSTNPALNFFQTIPDFSAEKLKDIFEKLNAKDFKLLDKEPKEPGVFFEYSPTTIAIFQAAESDPSIIHEYKEEILENYPELADEIEYIENMEDTGGLYVYPNEAETHYLAAFFRDYGTLVNKGLDEPLIKNLKRKPRQRKW